MKALISKYGGDSKKLAVEISLRIQTMVKELKENTTAWRKE